MKNSKFLGFFLFSIILFSISCNRVEDIPETTDPAEINALISAANPFSVPDEYEPIQTGSDILSTETATSGLQYSVTTKPMKTAKRFNKTVSFGSNKKNINGSADLYVGSIVQGKHLFNGQLSSIGDIVERKPITITVNGIDLPNNSVTVEEPSNASITEAINNLFSGVGDIPLVLSQIYKFEKTEAFNKNQALLSLGLNFSYMGLGVEGDFGFSNTAETRNVFILFKQEYFTISSNYPGTPADFFADDVDIEKLKYVATPDNPLGYISSVTYGRMLVAKVSSSYSQSKMKEALGAKFGNWGGSVSAEQEKILSKCEFKVQVAGGNSETVIDNLDEIYYYLDSGMSTLTSLSQAVPISYEVKYMSNNELFYTGAEVEYQEKQYLQTTEMQDFIVKIEDFYIYNDCDDGFLDNTGEGEFFYTIKINDEIILETNQFSTKNASDGQYIILNQSFPVSLPKISGQKIKIECILQEYDEGYIGDNVGTSLDQFAFPWSDDTLFNTYYQDGTTGWETIFQQSSVCKAGLDFTITKVQ